MKQNLATDVLSSFSKVSRSLSWASLSWNTTADDEFTSNLKPAADVSVNAVKSSFFFNSIVLLLLVATYEVLRRMMPSVYSARKMRTQHDPGSTAPARGRLSRDQSVASIPSHSYVPMDWVAPVLGVQWQRVREVAGLDGYFFLRYLRMCLRITAVSSFWAFIILLPVFATGYNGAQGWYHLSMVNIEKGTWRMWIPTIFIYLFSAFCIFVMKQEYRHFLQLRMEFLGKGGIHLDPQHHYSLMVENVPFELRSDRALYDYFNNLFPGKVHSARIMLKLRDLQDLSVKGERIVRRLEKSIAYEMATGERPSHVVGRGRIRCCGIDLAPVDAPCLECSDGSVYHMDEDNPFPLKGTRVDDISYYTREMAECNRDLLLLQRSKIQVAETGNTEAKASSWLGDAMYFASDAFSEVADQILEDSLEENSLRSHPSALKPTSVDTPSAENMTSSSKWYGSFGGSPERTERKTHVDNKEGTRVSFAGDTTEQIRRDKRVRLVDEDHLMGSTRACTAEFIAPFAFDKDLSFLRRLAGRLGLDFLIAGIKFVNKRLDVVVGDVIGANMSSTGFVTFLDLTSVTCAAGAPLTLKPGVLEISVAPEPRDIRWSVVHTNKKLSRAREGTANILLVLGVILWSIPVTAIQAFATAEQVARIPGMEWVLTFNGGSISAFINGYLPVLALLGLILILPFIFHFIAVTYEKRKTLSDVQRSILERYFYYQLANIYVTVTAGSLWNSLADIIDRPSYVLEILGQSLPQVVGYFVSMLITKIMAGLPMVMLRTGALGRMLFLRAFFSRDSLTQRELDEVYRADPVQYGWEYPTQLLVIVICFTYACISPVILPFGAIYFLGALMVYKKQILYVYTPTYESGASFFPLACDRTLFGLICGQLTFLGYCIIRQCKYEPIVLLPLPFITRWVMTYFRDHYAEPSQRLTMERAIDCDRASEMRPSIYGKPKRDKNFNKDAYRQPVLAQGDMEPLPYRRETMDPLTSEAIERLRQWSHRYEGMYQAPEGNSSEILNEKTSSEGVI